MTKARRRKQWCYDCQAYTLVRAYPTDLLEAVIDLCDPCASTEPPANASAQPVDNPAGHAPHTVAKGDSPPSNYDPSNITRSQS